MGRGSSAYTDKQVQRRIAALEKAGKVVKDVRYFPDHYELVLAGKPGEPNGDNPQNEWDQTYGASEKVVGIRR